MVPTGAWQATLVMFQFIPVTLLNRGVGRQRPVMGHIERHTTPDVGVAAVTCMNPNVHRVVPRGPRHELPVRAHPRGQNLVGGRGTQMTPAPPMTE